MKAALAAAALLAATIALAHADEAPLATSQFTFHAPKGWKLDTEGGDPHVYTVAVDEAHHTSFQARAQIAPNVPMSAEFLERFADNMRKSITTRAPDVKFEVIDKQLVNLPSGPAARFITEMVPDDADQAVRQLLYYVPGDGQHAVLTYTVPRAEFAKLLPMLEASAKATKVKKPQPAAPAHP